MKVNLARLDLKYAWFAVILVILSMGCLCLPTGITPTPNPPVTQTERPAPTNTPKDVEVPVSSGELNSVGPYLLIETDVGLWVSNPDGSGLTQFTDTDYWQDGLQKAIQPQGSLVVFRDPGYYDLKDRYINLISIPDGESYILTSLASSETQGYWEEEKYNPVMALDSGNGYAWSPDGTRLAFVGLMDGPSADIYLYNFDTNEEIRVSTDEEQDYWVSWSPDGNRLLYLSAPGFGSGAGFDTTGVWQAWSDGSDAHLLYAPESGVEEVVGWLNNTTVVLNNWSMDCISKLRLLDLSTHQVTMVHEGCITNVAASAEYGAVLFSNDSGLYILTDEARAPIQVSSEPEMHIQLRHESDCIFTLKYENGGIATYNTISSDGFTASPVDFRGFEQDVAMAGAIWAWTSESNDQPGTWITGPGLDIGQIFTGKARAPIWSDDNNLLFFAWEEGGGMGLYLTTFSGYYQDLMSVGFINAFVVEVGWIVASPPG